MSLLQRLAEKFPETPERVRLKAAVLFAGVRYDRCLPEAAAWAFPNYMPHMLPPGETWDGKRQVNLPYLIRTADDTQIRLRIKDDSPFVVRKLAGDAGFGLYDQSDRLLTPMTFEPRQRWVDNLTSDGTPMRATGLSQHGEMLVLNVAPGCEYFVVPKDGKTANLSCSFCLYGLPDKQRLEPLGQKLYETALPQRTLDRVVEACLHPETDARQLYLVGGSMLDMAAEGERFVQMAEAINAAGLHERYYVAAGSGAIPRAHMERLKALGVRGACFNLEVWDPAQFARVCPGKDAIVGRDRWIGALEEAVDVFGPENVMTAFVAGAELDGEGAFEDPRQAIESNIEAAETLIPKGIQTIFSLHWKVTGKNRGEEPIYSLDAFLELNERLAAIRRRENRLVNREFFSRRSAYMQLEPDYDHPPTAI